MERVSDEGVSAAILKVCAVAKAAVDQTVTRLTLPVIKAASHDLICSISTQLS